jgi:hypothetical protein
MAEVETLNVRIEYDWDAVKDALRAERMWYLEAFRKIEYELEGVVDCKNEGQVCAMATCRDRIRKLEKELGE